MTPEPVTLPGIGETFATAWERAYRDLHDFGQPLPVALVRGWFEARRIRKHEGSSCTYR